jgi:hypothetical protein
MLAFSEALEETAWLRDLLALTPEADDALGTEAILCLEVGSPNQNCRSLILDGDAATHGPLTQEKGSFSRDLNGGRTRCVAACSPVFFSASR